MATAKATTRKKKSTTDGAQNSVNPVIQFVAQKKKEMKESKYRQKFDNLYEEIQTNLVNTAVSYGQKLYERSGWGSVMTYTKTATGNTDLNVYPQKLSGRDQNQMGTPVSQEPIAFSKIITAASVLGGKLPDATVVSDSKVYSKAMYDLWKKGWADTKGNGSTVLEQSYQNLFTYGWAAWRTYPRRVQVKRKGVWKLIFDGIYREPLDPRRTWLGVGFNNMDFFSRFEVYYEKDIPKSLFMEMYPQAVNSLGDLETGYGVTQESRDQDNDNQKNKVTLGYYENMLTNRFIVVCGDHVIYDGELPNDDSYGSIVVANCFIKDPNDPHGVGLYEMMRGNTAIFTYINSLNAQQVEAEIFPILFGTQIQNGTGTYRRGPNIINPKNPGTNIDIVRTTGNLSAGIQFADKQKQDIEDNTGVNNIIAGSSSENTLGSTVILAEAARNRLILPRNSMVRGLELDACISNSWQRQIMSVDKVFLVDTDEELAEFARQNPDYFMESQEITGDDAQFKGYAIVASPNLRLNYDFDEKGNLLENVPERRISAKALFDEMSSYGHTSPYIQFIVDPNSMLLPSKEIEKQQYATMFPVVTNQLTLIFSMRMQDPQAAASQLRALECLLKRYNESIYSYMSKETYDEIMSGKPSATQMAMSQMKNDMGMGQNEQGEQEEPSEMTNDGTNPLQPQSPEEIPRPQGALGSSFDASMGYASALPFTPNK